MTEQEQLYAIALTMLSHTNLSSIHDLYLRIGSATEIIEQRTSLRSIMPDISPRLEQTINNIDEALHKAEAELTWARNNKVEVIPLNSPSYPQRLKDCPDAPVVLYYKGNGDLNHKKIMAVVGTRRSTTYGTDLLRHLMDDLKDYTEVMVVSGLAYGIDIAAHREALAAGFPTVAVLAHGLDMLYPTMHQTTATQMLTQGGLITEYPSQTYVAKGNFVQRNRIVAGIADCVIVVESAAKGGALITASIASSYNRDIFAFPGAVNATYSQGCNNLIRDNKAALISNADDLVKAMGWDDEVKIREARKEGIPLTLFNDLTEDEKVLVELLQKTNDLQVNVLTVRSNIPIHQVLSLLSQLELRGIVKPMAGGTYHLL